jgi:short-subunit dehydrogenase
MPHPLQNCRCLVTGASSGLGRAIASALIDAGARVLATGRDSDRLSNWLRSLPENAQPRATTLSADLTSEADRAALTNVTRQTFDNAVDIVVHAAGVGAYGRFLSHEPWVLRTIVEVNFFALAELSRLLHPLLCRSERPTMAVIGSVVARRGLPGRSEYSASKFALAGWVEAIRAEWAYDGINVLLVNPGFTRTDFEQHLLVDTAFHSTRQSRYRPPEHVAKRVLAGIVRRRREIQAVSLPERTLLLANRFCPFIVDRGLGRWASKLYRKHNVPRGAEPTEPRHPHERPPGAERGHA